MILFSSPKTNIDHSSNDYHDVVESFINEFNKTDSTNTSEKYVSECCKKAVNNTFGENSGKFISINIDKII